MATSMKYYADEAQTAIRTELVDEEALKYAKKFVPEDKRDKNRIKASQLRKFYADVKSCESAWKNSSPDDQRESTFPAVLPRIKILKAKVEYAKGRKVVPDDFAAWLSTCVDGIKNGKDFEAFLLHFEAVVGYCYGQGLTD